MKPSPKNARAPFTPTKGGDGGAAPKPRIAFRDQLGILRNRSANARQAMNAGGELHPTAAVTDRAHDFKVGGMLRPSWINVKGRAKLNHSIPSKARLYADCYLTGENEAGQRVSFETVTEETERKRCKLAGQIEARVGSQPEESETSIYVRSALEAVTSIDPERAKQIKRRRVAYGTLTREESRADREAEAWAQSRGVDITVSGMSRA